MKKATANETTKRDDSVFKTNFSWSGSHMPRIKKRTLNAILCKFSTFYSPFSWIFMIHNNNSCHHLFIINWVEMLPCYAMAFLLRTYIAHFIIQKFHSKRDISQLENEIITIISTVIAQLYLYWSFVINACVAVRTCCTVLLLPLHTYTLTRIFVLDLSHLKLTVLYMAYWHSVEWTVNKLKSPILQGGVSNSSFQMFFSWNNAHDLNNFRPKVL